MRKRFQLVLVAVGVIIVAVVAWEVLQPREPRYEGRPITSWIEDAYGYGSFENQLPQKVLRQKANEAVLAIGTNALPFYVSLLATKQDSELRYKVYDLIEKQHWFKFNFIKTWAFASIRQRSLGQCGLQILGPDAKTAIPALTKLLNEGDEDQAGRVEDTLPKLGPDGIPPLTNYIANIQATNRWSAVCFLGFYARQNTNDSLEKIKTPEEIESSGKIIIPFLIPYLNDNDPRVRSWTFDVLGQFAQEPEIVVPAVIEALKKSRKNLTVNLAVSTLAKFGPKAKAAVPVLLELVNDPDPENRSEALDALKQIDPEVAAKAGVK